MSAPRAFFALCFLVSVSGCGSGDPEVSSREFIGPKDGLSSSCHPFRAEGACGVPFPSSFWMAEDPTTSTGYRLDLSSEIVGPSASTGNAFDNFRWNDRDGFSMATPIVVYFPEKLDPASLPSHADFQKSLSPTSATVLVDMETNERVAHFAELDLSADIEPTDRQPIMIRPARHLSPNHRYAVGITRSLKTLEGGTPETPVGFESALSGAKSSDQDVKKALDALPETLASLKAAGIDKKELLLAWDFRTASLEQSTKNVLSMRDQALAKVGEKGIGFTITSVEPDPSAELHKRIRGTFKVPSFLTNDDRSVAASKLVFGSDGKPAIQRDSDANFELDIPASAVEKGPFPLLVYGHGLLGGADEVSGSHVRKVCNDKHYVCIGTDWIGLSETEEAGIGASGAAIEAVQDINALPYVSDRLQQALVNFMALVRAARSIVQDPQALLPNGKSAISDPPEVVYYGISQGGIMGMSLMAYTPDIERGVLQVGGSAYSLMIQRSVNWNQFFPAVRNAYPDRVTQQLVMALWQSLFDDSEGSGTAWAQGKNPPLAGTTEKHLLMQIAVGDSQVTNLAAETQARTLGLPLLTPSAKDVWGLETTQGGADRAIAFWDLGREPPPATNATPTTDNDVHGDIRKHELNQQQTDTFLRTGKAENPCGGACSFPGWTP